MQLKVALSLVRVYNLSPLEVSYHMAVGNVPYNMGEVRTLVPLSAELTVVLRNNSLKFLRM